jgi:cell division septal protein FtsQ
MSPVAVSADRRFHRARVKPARRRAGWQRLIGTILKYGVAAALTVFAVSRGAALVTTTPLLRIDQIRPEGNHRLSSDAVVGMLDGLRGENILFADLEAWRARLVESPWIESATFRRSLPSTVAVLIHERTPVAIGRINDRLYLVDDRGASIDEYGPQYGSLDLPIVDGFARGDGNEDANAERGALAARLIVSLRQKSQVAGRLSQVDVSDVHNVTILLDDDPAELRVGDSHFLERVESYLSLSEALHQRVTAIDYVDLRFDGRVYVRPLGKAGRGTTAGAGRPRVNRVSDAGQH